MPPNLSRPSTRDAAGPLPRPAAPARRRGSPPARPGRMWGWWAAIAGGLIATALLAMLIRSELYPADLAEADAAYRRNDLGTALRLAQGYLARRPTNRRAALLAARCLSRLGQPDQAETHYRKAGHLDFEDQHIRAFGLVVNNRREPAIQAYREILERRPDDVLALSRMAGVLISESRWDDALETSERLIKIPDGAVIDHTLAGVVNHNKRDSELAVFAFSRVLELDPDLKKMPLKPRSMFWTEFSHNLIEVGRGNEARRYLHRALAEGNDAKVADLLGQSYYLEGALDDAEQCWRLALQWDPDRFGTWWRIGKLELQRGRPAEAIEALLRAAALEPKAGGPLYSLALAYRRLGRREESDRFMEKLKHLQAEPTKPPRDGMEGSLIGTEEIAR
ncbi:MAG TPA: tetratricopeptide repeat protein [Isosphaeraceae bacterium]|nr:tetratricopeptide repeat protein [Isosphaeraceae bacterium]